MDPNSLDGNYFTTTTTGTGIGYNNYATSTGTSYTTYYAPNMTSEEFFNMFLSNISPEFLLDYIGKEKLLEYLDLDNITLSQGIDFLEE